MKKIRAQISIEFGNTEEAECIFNALQPETLSKFSDRSSALLQKNGQSLQLKIDASDITAFRATINSYLIWLRALRSISPLFDH